jgi:hypothetical protein
MFRGTKSWHSALLKVNGICSLQKSTPLMINPTPSPALDLTFSYRSMELHPQQRTCFHDLDVIGACPCFGYFLGSSYRYVVRVAHWYRKLFASVPANMDASACDHGQAPVCWLHACGSLCVHRLQKTTTKAKLKRHPSRLRLHTHVALCSFCGAVFAPHELLPKDKRVCVGKCGIPRDLMKKQSHGTLRV